MSAKFVTRYQNYKPSGRTVNGRRIAVGVDIDGCVDPGMYKHETGFAVASLYEYKLQMITPIGMRAWMFVNCYSLDRGISRFVALYKWADILRNTPAVAATNVEIPDFKFLRRWQAVTKSLSPESLGAYLEAADFSAVMQAGDTGEAVRDELAQVLRWSKRVDELAHEASENLHPFPEAARAIRRMHELGVDVCAVSGTPEKHVIGHLEEYGLIDCFQAVYAQQAGKKHLSLSHIFCGSHENVEGKTLLDTNAPQYDLVMMFGDAPQDYKECKQANKKLGGSEEKPVRMFFIEAGRENETWKFYCDNVLDKFVSNTWSVEEEQKLINKGLANLDRVWDSGLAPIDTYAKRGEKN